ncbi:hypothetical protein F5Y16DRAFT_375842 [Xylariaceae sp. FL0255]|nr:hypothetical protein F5Y16DRAFT_375842 [Xylariaceae sp. FL0255]
MQGQCSTLELLTVWGALGSLGFARASGSTGPNRHRRQDNTTTNSPDIPTAENFIRRACSTVAVIGDYVYIDGGQVTESVDGSSPSNSPAYGVNTTWSIDLTQAWTNSTVQIQSIPKAAPALAKQVLWIDESSNSYYTWGGFVVESGESPPVHELWNFQTDGTGGGTWSQVSQQDYIAFEKLLNPIGASYTQSGMIGYAFGGSVVTDSDSSIQDVGLPGMALPGLVSYDFQTGQWTNSSTSYYGGYGTNIDGRAQYIPFGPNGLLMFLGGAETPIDATNDTIVQVDWNTVTLVDPVTGQSYTQTTSGTKPPTIESHCTVGVPGQNGTYEIFIYGGVSDQLRTTSGQMTVLSLPGFTFFEGPTDAARSDHECAIVGKGQRQMFSIGGVDGENRTYTAPTTADPWTYSIGIFDMTDLTWLSSYDPNATTYDSPDVVKQWYAAGNLDNVQWDDDALKNLMLNTTSTTDASQASSNGSMSRSVVAGGVAGGIAGFAILMTVSLLYRRRRKRSRAEAVGRDISNPFGTRVRRGRHRNFPYPEPMYFATESIQDRIAEYKPEPWPKDHSLTVSSPHSSMYSSPTLPVGAEGASKAFSLDGYPPRRSELPGDHVRPEELMGSNPEFAHELPAPLERVRLELPDREYPR